MVRGWGLVVSEGVAARPCFKGGGRSGENWCCLARFFSGIVWVYLIEFRDSMG